MALSLSLRQRACAWEVTYGPPQQRADRLNILVGRRRCDCFRCSQSRIGNSKYPEAGFMPFSLELACAFFALIVLSGRRYRIRGHRMEAILREAAWPNSFLVLGHCFSTSFCFPPRLHPLHCVIPGFLFRCIKPMSCGVVFGSILCTLGSWGLLNCC